MRLIGIAACLLFADGAVLSIANAQYYSVNDGGTPGGNVSNDGATAPNALAAGVGASASGSGAVAVGASASAKQFGDIAIGSNATASSSGGVPGVAIGGANPDAPAGYPNTNIASRGGVAVGFGTNANTTLGDKQGGTAIGTYASANQGAYGTALGYKANATAPLATVGGLVPQDGSYSTSIGSFSAASSPYATATGALAKATGNGSIALGGGAQATAANAITIGSANPDGLVGGLTNSQARSVLIGTASSVGSASSVSIGDTTSTGAAGKNVSIGANTKASASSTSGGAVAIGRGQSATGDGAVAIGDPNTANGQGAVTLGANETAAGNADGSTAAAGAVAIGNGNAAIGQGSVAIGNGSKAQSAGALAFGDAAIANNARDVALGSGSIAGATVATTGITINGKEYSFSGINPTSTVSVGGTGSERTITNVAAGRISSASTDAINGSQLYATNQAIGALDDAAVKYDQDPDGSKKNSITLVGGDPNTPVLISNVAAGSASTDAVNVGQLKDSVGNAVTEANNYTNASVSNAITTANGYTDQKFNQLNQSLDGVRSEARQAAAIGLAAASLRYDDRPGKASIAVGGGYWRDEGAFAVGAGYTSKDGAVRSDVSATNAGDHWGVGGGLSFTLN